MAPQSPIESSTKSKAKQIRNPRRLLILSPAAQSQTLIPSLLKQLTGHSPSETQIQTQSFAGYTTHPPLRIENRYYTAEVPVWVDEIPVSTRASTNVNTNGDGAEQAAGLGSADKEEDISSTTSESQKISEGGQGRKGENPSAEWSREFTGEEARVVRDAIGAVMICLRNPQPSSKLPNPEGAEIPADEDEDSEEVRGSKAFIRAVGTVRSLIEEERGEIGSVPGLLVLGGKKEKKEKPKISGIREDDLDLDAGLDEALDEPFSIGWWEDQLCEMGLIGFDVVEWDWTRDDQVEERNQYGELQGMRRVKEVLETHEWAGNEDEDLETGLPDDDDDLERGLLGLDEEASGFNNEVDELQREMVGLRFAIERGGDGNIDDDNEGDEELQVDAVEALLTRMRAIKDMSDELPEKERKRFAAKAVRDIMKEI
ncbi:adaptin-binding domain-containing protein [Aspergillus mulundensis]|uniref:Alpha and gamma adaptin binding protein p34 n=1 Tax=Aspergillus mulundensis TaxID=1810919 RepID=A0A3D8S473_9EURO|nr:Uncharacterized protein DSM5745_04613 [Aspergillus mulundensis]RDW81056.1 Uncharacterized protein DSM5745_04613 [Aspergillus mulundensis]